MFRPDACAIFIPRRCAPFSEDGNPSSDVFYLVHTTRINRMGRRKKRINKEDERGLRVDMEAEVPERMSRNDCGHDGGGCIYFIFRKRQERMNFGEIVPVTNRYFTVIPALGKDRLGSNVIFRGGRF